MENPKDLRRFPVLKADLKTEVVVVGGGITGVTAAWELARRGVKTVLLEKAHLASDSTGYTTAFVSRVPDLDYLKLAKTLGVKKMRLLTDGISAAQDYLRDLVRDQKINCEWQDTITYVFDYKRDQKSARMWEIFRKLFSSVVRAGVLDRMYTGVPISDGIIFGSEAYFNPRKFIFGLLQKPAAKKIKVFEETEVTAIEPAGKKLLLRAGKHKIIADKVVLATGTPQLFADLQKYFQKTDTYVYVANYRQVPISNDMFYDMASPYHYIRRVSKTQVLFGGEDTRKNDAKSKDQAQKKLRNYIERYWAGEHKYVRAWQGSIFNTKDTLPYVAEHPRIKNIFTASGFAGCGMVLGAMSGLILADLVRGKAHPLKKLLDFNRVL